MRIDPLERNVKHLIPSGADASHRRPGLDIQKDAYLLQLATICVANVATCELQPPASRKRGHGDFAVRPSRWASNECCAAGDCESLEKVFRVCDEGNRDPFVKTCTTQMGEEQRAVCECLWKERV